MKKNITLLLASCMLIVLTQCQSNEKKAKPDEEQISGAYEALNFFGARTTYPAAEIPQNAYYSAWEEQERMAKAENQGRGGTLPWEAIGPHNRGGRTLALEFNPQNPNTLWIGTASGGLWRSYTEGLGAFAWEYVETGFPVLGVSCISFPPADSTTMYIGTGEVYNHEAAGTGAAYRSTRGSYGMGILKSTDGGQTWEQSLDWSYDQNRGIWAIKIDPTNSNIVYAATTHGVYKSTDAGENWTQQLDIAMANDLVINPNNTNELVIGVGNLGSPGKGIYRSVDAGENWTQITQNLPSDFQGKIQLNYAPSSPNILYASIGNGFSSSDGASWLCRSTNFGANWTVVNQTDYSIWQGWFAHDIDVSANDPDHLVVVGITAWKTTNGGQSLVEEAEGGIGNPNADPGDNTASDFVHSDCHDVKFHPTNPNLVYVTSDGGVHRSTDGGETYQLCTGGLQNCQFYNGFSNSYQDPSFCMGGLQDNGTIAWNGDLTWTVQFGGDGSWTGINPQDDDIFYVSYQGLNLYRIENGVGQTYMDIPKLNNTAFIAPYVLYPGDGNIIYAGHGGVSKTTNGGDSWQLVNNSQQLDSGNPVLSMDVATNDPDVVYAATAPTTIFGGTRGHVFVTQNGGATWQDRTGVLPDRYPMDVHVDPTDKATAYVTFSGFGSGHVYRTTDYGVSWTDISNGLPDVPTNAVVVDPLFPNNVYVGNDLGVFVSVDYGETWETYEDGLNTATMIFDLKISPANRKLRAATHGSGAYERDLVEIPAVAVEDLAGIVDEVEVYPNPARSFTNLSFDLVENEFLTIRMMDAAGRVVQEIGNTQYSVGKQRLRMDWDQLSSGSYYIQIISEKGTLTKKLLLQ